MFYTPKHTHVCIIQKVNGVIEFVQKQGIT